MFEFEHNKNDSTSIMLDGCELFQIGEFDQAEAAKVICDILNHQSEKMNDLLGLLRSCDSVIFNSGCLSPELKLAIDDQLGR